MADDARTARQRAALHHVSGIYVPCCEEGETDCPCVCHDGEARDEEPAS